MGFKERIERIITTGLESSKEVLERAAGKTKEAGERGTTRMKIRRLEQQAQNKFALLGSKVYDLLVEQGQKSVSKGTRDLKELIEEIKQLDAKIEDLEEQLTQIGRE
jgi:hypothetical protein